MPDPELWDDLDEDLVILALEEHLERYGLTAWEQASEECRAALGSLRDIRARAEAASLTRGSEGSRDALFGFLTAEAARSRVTREVYDTLTLPVVRAHRVRASLADGEISAALADGTALSDLEGRAKAR